MINNFFAIDDKLIDLASQVKSDCKPIFEKIDEKSQYNSAKVLKAFIDNRVSESHLISTTGYGYGDRGRDTLDRIFAQIVGAEDALVRHSFASGTHAITVALFGVLRPGDTILCITGTPYDTLIGVIDSNGEDSGSLKDFGISYEQLELLENEIDLNGLTVLLKDKKYKAVYIQRSRGYSTRNSQTCQQIKTAFDIVKQLSPNTITIVDNCYGEFVEIIEPTEASADLIIGSLIKNPGGGLARSGGYIAGKTQYISQCANRLTAPSVGREVGATLEQNRNLYMGLFNAPHVTAQALKTAVFASALFSKLGFKVLPQFDEYRTDIIQYIQLGSPELLIAFCGGLQSGAPVDSFVTPKPWDMPGYDSQVIMAAGTFISGASIELSADAPLREPFGVWLQGGLTFESSYISILLALQELKNGGYNI